MPFLRSFRLPASIAAVIAVLLAGCAPQRPTGGPGGHPNPIIVREFAASLGVVTLDPSLGFSLYRGAPGVPPRERAAATARAAAFNLADSIAEQLRSLGYDAIQSDDSYAEPGGKALIVTGAFHRIYEGHRHQGASVAVTLEVDSQLAGSAPTRLAGFDLDSRTVPVPPPTAGAARRAGVNLAAERVGVAIARYVAELARLNRWPAAR